MRQKKAQAAMEFLMTYGWALLVVLIAIGALAFFGVLNPSRFLPNSCTLAPGFACTDFKADGSDDEIIIVLQNGLGESLTSVRVELDKISGGGTGCPPGTLQTFSPNPFSFGDGATTQVTLSCAGLEQGSKLKADLIIYYETASGLPHSKVGQLVTGIEA